VTSDETKKGKVEIKIGNLTFSAEGDQTWLAEQLAKVIDAASPSIAGDSGVSEQDKAPTKAVPHATGTTGSLASYIKAKGGEANQVQRFLATAGWLHLRGAEKLTTSAVASALTTHHQKRLANTSDCLNKNCNKGFCEKQSGGFYITPEGWKALEEEQ
jgi:hypothetical protein